MRIYPCESFPLPSPPTEERYYTWDEVRNAEDGSIFSIKGGPCFGPEMDDYRFITIHTSSEQKATILVSGVNNLYVPKGWDDYRFRKVSAKLCLSIKKE